MSPGTIVHAYLVSDDKENINRIANEMINVIEQSGYQVLAPVFATTTLGPEQSAKVRAYLNETYPETIETMATMKNFHRTTWGALEDEPEWLMDLH